MPAFAFRLYLLVLLNGLTTIVAALNLSANVFVLKATRWTSVQVWSLDFPQLWLYYSPLLFPLWLWILLRADGNPAVDLTPAGDSKDSAGWPLKLRRLPSAAWTRARLLLQTIPPGLRLWIAAGTVLALVFGFPFAHVNLGDGPRLDTSVLLRHYWQTMVIAGVARPGAIFFCAAGLWVLLKHRDRTQAASEFAAENPGDADHRPGPKRRIFASKNAGRILFAALVAAILLRVALAGPAIPRLEDEVAYHVQALIFEAGRTSGELSGELAATGVSVARLGEILQLPYVFFDAVQAAAESAAFSEPAPLARYFSAHFHGWSALLAALSFVSLKPYANAILMIANCGLFALLMRRSLAREFAGDKNNHVAFVFALFLFACAPATLILTGTYMSHVATQSLLLLLFLIHGSLRIDGIRAGAGRSAGRMIVWTLAIAVALGALAFVRLQAAVPALIALVLADLFLIAANLRAGKSLPAADDSRFSSASAGLRLAALAVGATVALWTYDAYVRSLGADDWFFTRSYLHRYFEAGCQAVGWGPGHGCFPTYGSLGHSFQKFLLNGFDRVSELNHELSPAGLPLLPIALLLAVRHWRKLVDPRQVWLKFALAFLGATGVYSLYFHNGGESYRGRYVFEAVFAFYLIFAKLANLELQAWLEGADSNRKRIPEQEQAPGEAGPDRRDRLCRVLLILTPFILVTNVAFTIRGDYFSRFIQPFANINDVVPRAPSPPISGETAARIENTLIGTRDLVEQLGERDERTGDFYYPLEFEAGERAALPLGSMKAFLNLGYPTLAATATRLDEYGLLRDAHDNALVGPAAPAEMRKLAAFLRIQKTRRLEYRLPETERIRRGLVRWILPPPVLKGIDEAPQSP